MTSQPPFQTVSAVSVSTCPSYSQCPSHSLCSLAAAPVLISGLSLGTQPGHLIVFLPVANILKRCLMKPFPWLVQCGSVSILSSSVCRMQMLCLCSSSAPPAADSHYQESPPCLQTSCGFLLLRAMTCRVISGLHWLFLWGFVLRLIWGQEMV